MVRSGGASAGAAPARWHQARSTLGGPRALVGGVATPRRHPGCHAASMAGSLLFLRAERPHLCHSPLPCRPASALFKEPPGARQRVAARVRTPPLPACRHASRCVARAQAACGACRGRCGSRPGAAGARRSARTAACGPGAAGPRRGCGWGRGGWRCARAASPRGCRVLAGGGPGATRWAWLPASTPSSWSLLEARRATRTASHGSVSDGSGTTASSRVQRCMAAFSK